MPPIAASVMRLPNSLPGIQFYVRQIIAVLGIVSIDHEALTLGIARMIHKLPPREGTGESKEELETRKIREFNMEDLVGVVYKVLNDGKFKYCRKRVIQNSWLITSRKKSLVILFAGTSGVGKSTLASIVASKLMISSFLSTDSIRHALRARSTVEDNPILFASTYECAKFLTEDEARGLTDAEKTVKGFETQCTLMEPYITQFLTNSVSMGRSVILEGVHLIPTVLMKLVRTLPGSAIVMCFVVTSQKDKHIEHMKWRGNQTEKGGDNKYVSSFSSITTIQDSIVKQAETLGVPIIDSFSVDKCLSLLQATLRNLLVRLDMQPEKRAEYLHEAFFEYAQHCLSKGKTGLLEMSGKRQREPSLTSDSAEIMNIL